MKRRAIDIPVFFLTALLLGCLGLAPASSLTSSSGSHWQPKMVEDIPLPSLYPASGPTIVLDAGHGGVQTGACYFDAEERFITLDIVRKLQPILEQQGYHVLLTRSDDEDVDLYRRADIANAAEADLFVSVHANVSEGHSAVRGVMTYVQPDKREGRLLGEAIHERLLAVTDGDDYGVQDENLAVLRETDMPAALAEVGFMSNPDECAQLTDPDYQLLLAQAIADGIHDYLLE